MGDRRHVRSLTSRTVDSPEHRELGSENSTGLPGGLCSGVGEEGRGGGVETSITSDNDDISLSTGWGPKRCASALGRGS